MTPRFPDPCPDIRTALFAGSFSPFTKGHLDILARGLALFDRIVVARGVNLAKSHGEDSGTETLKELLKPLSRVEVVEYSDLTVDCARRVGAAFLLRGARTVADFEYEKNLADVNRAVSDMETVILTARPELAVISSSTVRELKAFGKDVAEFLPSEKDIQKLI